MQSTYTLEQHDQARIHELESQVKELRLLTGWIVHDMAAPLRAVNGYALMLLEDHSEELSEDAKDLIERQTCAGQSALRLMEDVKRMIRSDCTPLDLHPVDLSALASEVASEMAASYGGSARIEVEPEMTALGDRNQLRFLFQNLIDNGIKHNTTQTPWVQIGCSDTDPGTFFVRDNGAGLDMGEAERLFSPFERGCCSKAPGTGLGLAIARRIVERHGGRIWVESAAGQGTTFWVSLGCLDARMLGCSAA